MQDCADLAANITAHCPSVRLLATSREPLRIYGETRVPVPALLPPSATELFLARAKAVRSDFRLTDQNSPVISQICGDLDGLPLAIELAASLVDIRTVAQIAARLQQRFDLLSDGPRAGAARHRSLRAAFDVSYDLLLPTEQALFRRLGVFAGGFTAEAVAAVSADADCLPLDTPSLLSQLVRKSLVIAEPQGEEMRYRLLVTLRQYAQDRLREQGEEEETRRKHREFYLRLAEEAEPKLDGPEQKQWLDRLEAEHDNFRTALSSCENQPIGCADEAERTNRTEAMLRMAASLVLFWQVHGYWSEGREWLDKAIKQCGEAERNLPFDALATHKGKALLAAGVLAYCQGDYDTVQMLSEKSLAPARLLGNQEAIAASLDNLGKIAFQRGDYGAATENIKESLSIWRKLGNQQEVAGLLNSLALIVRVQGDYGTAKILFEESLAIRRSLGNPEKIAMLLSNIGNLAAQQGNFGTAVTLLEESLTISRHLGDQQGIASTLSELGAIAFMRGDFGAARSLYDESLIPARASRNRKLVLHNLMRLGGVVLHANDDYDAAQRYIRESLMISRQLDFPMGIAYGVEIYSDTIGHNQPVQAVRMLANAHTFRLIVGCTLPLVEQESYRKQYAVYREALGEEAFAVAWAEGQAMTWEQAVAFALEEDAL